MEKLKQLGIQLKLITLFVGCALIIAVLATNWIMLFVGIVVFSAIFGWLIQNDIIKPIRYMQQATNKIIAGDLSARVTVVAHDEIGSLGHRFNDMVAKIQETSTQEAERVQKRIQALEASNNLTRGLMTIKSKDDLLDYVVVRLYTDFEFEYSQIYLVDEKTQDLILAKGFGEVGRTLEKTNHYLKAGQGIVGTVASTDNPFWSNNVHESLNFVSNRQLPKTKSELAVPLRREDMVVGVLDIQSEVLDRFTLSDVALLQALANQIAISLENIRLLAEMEDTLKEVERLNSKLTRTGWAETVSLTRHYAYRYIGGDKGQVMPIAGNLGEVLPQLEVEGGRQKNGADPQVELSVPLIVRGEVIGTMGIKKRNAATLTRAEKEVIEAVANQTSHALENARLSVEQERQIVKLQEVDRLKGEFLTSMSHELRTPLNSIIGFADILLQGIDGPLSEHALTDVTAIHSSGKHLLSLINDLLDLSKIEAGRMELACESLSLPEVFGDVASATAALFTKKAVELVIDVEDNLPPVWADPLRLNQILINLVGNGEKFTEEGQVAMHAYVHSEALIKVTVSDTGIGIPADKFDLIFQHFRQVDGRTNRKFQGTGMGLAIARELAFMHGGEMWLESTEGEGSAFHFTIPIATQEKVAAGNVEVAVDRG